MRATGSSVARVDRRGRAEVAGEAEVALVDVDGDDGAGAEHPRRLHHVQADAAAADHRDVAAELDPRGVHDGAEAR